MRDFNGLPKYEIQVRVPLAFNIYIKKW